MFKPNVGTLREPSYWKRAVRKYKRSAYGSFLEKQTIVLGNVLRKSKKVLKFYFGEY